MRSKWVGGWETLRFAFQFPYRKFSRKLWNWCQQFNLCDRDGKKQLCRFDWGVKNVPISFESPERLALSEKSLLGIFVPLERNLSGTLKEAAFWSCQVSVTKFFFPGKGIFPRRGFFADRLLSFRKDSIMITWSQREMVRADADGVDVLTLFCCVGTVKIKWQ